MMDLHKRYRKLYYLFSTWLKTEVEREPSDEKIDVVIPVIEKDLLILPLCLEAIKRFVTNKIQAIYIVAPDNEAIKKFCKEQEIVFINEDLIVGHGPREIHYILNDGRNRSGWIFQQLLKLAGNIGTQPNFLVIDADHILVRPHTFLASNGNTVFYRSREYHAPYYQSIKSLLGKRDLSVLSFVAHKMLFSREKLGELKEEIFEYTGKQWDKAILDILDVNEVSCFSEYEMYGNFFPDAQSEYLLFRNKSLNYQKLASLDELVAKYARRYRAVTFPDYKNG